MTEYTGVILIVDDVPTNLNVLMEFLETLGYRVLVAVDGESAIEQAEYARPDMILLDVMMPGIDGFETCRRLKESPLTSEIPIIFMSALSETVDKVNGFELGAADYITKPLQQEEVAARVNAHLTLHRQRKEIAWMREMERLQYERLSNAKDQILSMASHDLKNPLTMIFMNLEMLQKAIPADFMSVHKRLDVLRDASYQMRDLIVNLLDLARLETGLGVRKTTVSLSELLKTYGNDMVNFAADQNIELRIHYPEQDVMLEVDAFQIGQVMHNLLSNAIKYTAPEGVVEVGVELQDKQVAIIIADTGFGIPEADIPHVFERFYRVRTGKHAEVSGTGLGLSIVQEIVQQHGGHIAIASELGVGTTFSVALPMTPMSH